MAKNQRDYIISHGKHLFEYGSGGSTVEFCKRLKVTSVEHDAKWYGKMPKIDGHEYILRERQMNVVNVKTAEENPLGLNDYITESLRHPQDMVLVDGVARGACLAYLKSTFDGPVFLHDAQRDWYDWAISLYPRHEEIPADDGDYPPLLVKLW